MSGRAIAKLSETDQFEVVTFHIRGREYEVREMPGEDYEEALRSAAVIDDEGNKTDRTDMMVFERLLAVESVKIDGKPVDLEDWNALAYRVQQRVLVEVKRLHWVDIETDEEKAARAKALKDSAKKSGGSAKQAESDIPNS